MFQFYELLTAGAAPVVLADMKSYLRITFTTDDVLIQELIDAATEDGEKYTARDFRDKTYKLLIDVFEARICLFKSPVDSITTVKHLVSSVLATVPNTVYYLKKNQQFSEILLQDGQEWPTDTDTREQAIEIEFATIAFPCGNAINTAIKKWVLFAYTNRGDCDACADSNSIGDLSGANFIYNKFRISRV